MDKKLIGLGLAFVGGIALGGGGGYFIAAKKLGADFDKRLTEEIALTRDFYKRTYKLDDFETPESAAEVLLDDAVEALRSYSYEGVTVKEEDLVDSGSIVQYEEVVEKNIFDNGNRPHIDKADRSPDKPYVVDLDEYMENPNEYDQISLTYYAGDNVLANDEDEVVDNVNNVVGQMNLNMFGASDPEEPHVVLVRNERIKADYEITHSDGKYAHQVLGFQHSDETFQRMRQPRARDE